MASIVGADGLTVGDVFREIGEGGRFVVYEYCVSPLLTSYRNASAVHFARRGERYWGPALGLSAVSLVAGWWNLPSGPIWTVSSIFNNLAGGKDVTEEIMALLSDFAEDMPVARVELRTVYE